MKTLSIRATVKVAAVVAFAAAGALVAAVVFAQQTGQSQAKVQTNGQANAPGSAQASAQGNGLSLQITPQELTALGDRIAATQHKDDLARDQYERIEHHVVTSGQERRLTEDKTYRVIPTGSGTMKITIKNGTAPADPAAYRAQLQECEQALEIASNPNDYRAKAALAKAQKKNNERKELVDAARRVFQASLVGREMRNGQLVDVLELNPNPNYQPHTLAEEALTKTKGKAWVQEETGQILSGSAEVVKDVSFGGGFLGKLYKGTHVTADNMQVEPDLWLPRRGQFDYAGRKFIFTFDTHETTEVSHYRLVGGPAEMLAMIKKELAGGAPVPADP
jgi:hypothetical protein